jgi:hypothetical protein
MQDRTAAPRRSSELRDVLASIGLSLPVRIAVVAVVGALVLVGSELLWDPPDRLFLDHELGVPALFSACLLIAAAAAALIYAHTAREVLGPRTREDLAAVLLAGFFAFMAVDEGLYIHERLQGVGGVPWSVWYLPVAALGGLAWLGTVASIRGLARRYMVAGALAWALSLVIETFLYGDENAQDPVTMPIEEAAEMSGSILFALGMLHAARMVRHEPAGG